MKPARIALITGVLIISTYPTLVKLGDAPSVIGAFYRMAIAGAILLPYAIITKQFVFPSFKITAFAVLSGLFIALDIAFWNIAIKESTAMQATLLVNLAPVWVGIGSYFFLRLNPSRNFWLGALVSFIGMAIIVGLKMFLSLSFDKAFLYALIAGIFYAAYIITSKRALNQLSVISFFSISILSACLVLAGLNIYQGNAFTGYSTKTWCILFAQGVFVQLIAWFLINYALKNMRATRVSLSLLSQAFLSGIIARFVIDEAITNQMIVGGSVLLIGIALTFYEKDLFASLRNRS